MLTADQELLRQTIELARANVARGGGPFGALVVRDGVILARGANEVTLSQDPTAHAEVVAIREACRILGSHQLTGCHVYASCEPCPMCLGALFWARPEAVFYAATRYDAAAAGFDDSLIYDQIAAPGESRVIPMIHTKYELALTPFEDWAKKADRVRY